MTSWLATALLALAPLGEVPIDADNWQSHPRIVAVRAIFQDVERAIASGVFERRVKTLRTCRGSGDELRELLLDSDGRVRRYVKQTKIAVAPKDAFDEGTSRFEVALTYSEAGTLRFALVTPSWAVGGGARVYFDEAGAKLFEEPFGAREPWPPSLFERSPLAAFAAPLPCAPEVPKPTMVLPAAEDTRAPPTDASFRTHPLLALHRALYEVASAVVQRDERQLWRCTSPGADVERVLWRDGHGRVRMYLRRTGGLDYEQVYDDDGRLRFVYISDDHALPMLFERRIYLDADGTRLFEQHQVHAAHSKRPDVWPDDDLARDAAHAFEAPPSCAKPTPRLVVASARPFPTTAADPRVIAARQVRDDVVALVKAGRMKKRGGDIGYCNPDEDSSRTIGKDEAGRVRLYQRGVGGEDSASTLAHYYDERGALRLVEVDGAAVNGVRAKLELIFGSDGAMIFERRVSGTSGGGYGFWSDSEIVRSDPSKAFRARRRC